jgi:hypothetical protein
MNSLGFILFLSVVAIVVAELLRPTRKKKRDWREPVMREQLDERSFRSFREQFQVPYIPRALMTAPEKKFFKVLAKVAAEQGLLVAPQVAMSALVDVPRKYNENRFAHINRAGFAQKRLDYVLIDMEFLEPVLVVELDDPSHDGREYEDARREDLLEAAGYKVLRVDVRERLSPGELAEKIAASRSV